jgi:beta-galactosidase
MLALATVACWLLNASAQVKDAFQGVLPVTDQTMMRRLNGEWSLKVIDGIGEDPIVPAEDGTWGRIPVPGCWEAYGFCKPKYDSPNPLTGYYRTTFTVPGEWRGQRIVLRFDGVLYGYDLWVNGKQAGSWRSGYNTALFDVTDFLKKDAVQDLAMRVISQFPGSDFDYNDDWAPNGIFRDVTLMAVPNIHLSDLTIHTKNTGEVSVDTKVANANKQTTITHEILDAQGRIVGSSKVENPHLWTAETPYLYTLRTKLMQKGKTLQTFEHKFGFRELTIDGNILKLNGQPIKLRGVTSHSTDPKTVKVISDELTLKDMRLMKEASVNYIRTSHYPREPRFYELADSLGFYIIDEVPFGYGDKNLYKDEFYPILQQRAQATIRRDKNHASVLIWSLGNENPLTNICQQLGNYVKSELDPSRPICYPQVGSYFRKFNYNFPKVADIYTPHYPTTSQVGSFYQRADRPVIFTEYLHTLGISFEDHDRQWEIIERTPCIAGGSVWEWVDQGMPFKSGERLEVRGKRYGYEEKVYTSKEGGFSMFGNKGTDGLLYADRTPLPNYYELQHNYAQAAITDSIITLGEGQTTIDLHIRNRFDFLNLKDNVTFHWVLTQDRDTIACGAFSPDCQPHQAIVYPFGFPATLDTRKICLLNIEISDTQGRIFNRQSIPINPKDLTDRLLSGLTETAANPMSVVQGEMMVRAGRKATLAETLKVGDKRLKRYLLPLSPDGTSAGSIKTDIKTENVGRATHVKFSLTPDTTDTFLSELGIALLLDQQIDRVQWIGQGVLPTYPGRYRAGRYGFWSLQQGDLYFEGNRRGVDAAWLTDKDGNGLLLVCNQGNVSFEQTDRGIVLTYNAAVSGQGPKFARTAFPVIAKEVGTISGDFYLYRTDADNMPELLKTLFVDPQTIPSPFRPFKTQYDTYLMKFDSIIKQ